MTAANRKLPPWAGFLIGLLAIGLPIGLYLGVKEIRDGRAPASQSSPVPRAPAGRAQTPAPAAPSTPSAPAPRRDDARPLRDAGASVLDPRELPDDVALGRASQRVAAWLSEGSFDPYAGVGIDSLRLFALETECWHRLAVGEGDPARRAAYEEEFLRRARLALDPARLSRRLGARRSAEGWIEILMLADRGVEHGLDRDAIRSVFQPHASKIGAEMDRGTRSAGALIASYLASIDLDVGRPFERYRDAGVLARRPREIEMNVGDVYGLVQEIHAIAGLRRNAMHVSILERDYLRAILPFFSITYLLLGRHEMVGDLVSCLNLLSMTETYGYREGLRVLLARQNPDGSFGEGEGEGRAGRIARLPATTSCITAISLERIRARGRK